MVEIQLHGLADLAGLVKTLATEMNEPMNVANASHSLRAHEALGKYLTWVERASGQLGNQLVPEQVEALLLTRHFWALRQMDGSEANVQAQLVRELRARGEALKQLHAEAERLVKHWHSAGVFVMLDTNMLVQTTRLFDAIDWPKELGIDDAVRLVVPMQVVDELDKHKQNKTNENLRSKARAVIRKIRALVDKPGERGTLVPAAVGVHGTTFEVYVYPLTHVRLADADSEIVSRALYLSSLVRTPKLKRPVAYRDPGWRDAVSCPGGRSVRSRPASELRARRPQAASKPTSRYTSRLNIESPCGPEFIWLLAREPSTQSRGCTE